MKTTTSRVLVSLSLIALAGCATSAQADSRTAASDQARQQAACAGIPEAQRTSGPFGTSATAAKVEPLVEQVKIGKQTYPRTVGAKVTVMAEPGLTSPWLARLAVCHAALHDAGDVAVTVTEAPTSFVVSLRSQSQEGAERVLHIAESLSHLGVAQNTNHDAADSRSATAGTPTP